MDKDGNLKICELAEQSGVSVSTIKYYISLGLIDNTYKTSRNMSYYTPSTVGRIKLIRKLQKERYYPLSVIKRILILSADTESEMDLIDAIYKHDSSSHVFKGENKPKIPEIDGLNQEQIKSLVEAGVVGQEGFFSDNDFRILNIVAKRNESGMSFENTLETFSSYSENLKKSVEDDINSMIRNSFLTVHLSNTQLVSLIRNSDSTLEEFVSIKRQELNRRVAMGVLGEMSVFAGHFISFINKMVAKVYGSMNLSSFLAEPSHSELSKCISEFKTMSDKCNVSLALDAFVSMIDICSKMKPSDFSDPVFRGIAGCIRLGFYSLCPAIIYDSKLVYEATSFCHFDERILNYLGLSSNR